MRYGDLSTKQLKNELEDIIDNVGVSKILDLMSVIAYEKSDHIMHTWQDENLAGAWQDTADLLDEASNNGIVRAVSQ